MTPAGLYCPRTDVYIDPVKKVPRAIITHAHSDHAKRGMTHHLCHHQSREVLQLRLGRHIALQGLEYGRSLRIIDVTITLFPAGHIPGSAQIRLACDEQVWVVSGDYKTENNGLSAPWEPVSCTQFITETTFGMPVYKWQDQSLIFKEINQWWKANKEAGINTILRAYSLGKAQCLMAH